MLIISTVGGVVFWFLQILSEMAQSENLPRALQAFEEGPGKAWKAAKFHRELLRKASYSSVSRALAVPSAGRDNLI